MFIEFYASLAGKVALSLYCFSGAFKFGLDELAMEWRRALVVAPGITAARELKLAKPAFEGMQMPKNIGIASLWVAQYLG